MSEIDVVHAAGSTSSMLEGVLDINSPSQNSDIHKTIRYDSSSPYNNIKFVDVILMTK